MLLDEDGAAASIVGTGTIGWKSLTPRAALASTRALAGGNRQFNAGRRPMQLGATIVLGPGNELIYEDFEGFAGDHAPFDEVIAALSSR